MPPGFDASPETQAKRMELINKLITQGIFQKVEKPGSLPHVWVAPSFYSLNFDDKESFVSVVYAYYFAADPKVDLAVLYDSKTGKQVGVYGKVYGGLKMD